MTPEDRPSPGSHSGRSGEAMACRHLERNGLTVIARNVRCRSGEVDIVARDGATTVFVEVKERRTRSHGSGVESVTASKRRRIVRAALWFAMARHLGDAPVRFDVVSIDWAGGRPAIRHDRGAFDATGR